MALSVVGLGPGPAELLTAKAQQRLERARKLYLLTRRHPVVPYLPSHLTLVDFDHLAEQYPTYGEADEALLQQLETLVRSKEELVLAVPGHPLADSPLVPRLIQSCVSAGIPVEVIAGVSYVDAALEALAAAGLPTASAAAGRGVQVVDPGSPVVDPARPTLVTGPGAAEHPALLLERLLGLFPPQHEVAAVALSQAESFGKVTRRPLAALSPSTLGGPWDCLFLPALRLEENLATFGGLADIVARLRAPGGCPWDREQTHASLKPYLIEEAYEALEALDLGDMAALQEELGDLLLNILLHCQIAAEAGEFEARDVVRGIADKLIRRHPHVFGDLPAAGRSKVETAQQVMDNWEALKQRERSARRSMLEGLPTSLPALAYTRSLQERMAPLKLTATSGAPGPIPEATLHRAPGDATETLEALGERLLAVAFDAAAEGCDPEAALRLANGRFRRRFHRLEELAWEQGASLQELGAERRSELWEKVLREP